MFIFFSDFYLVFGPFEFCYKTSVLTMSSQGKLRGKVQRKTAFVDISSWIVYHFL